MTTPRVVCWFSCGDASAVACALAVKKYAATHEVVVARILIDQEHEDNDRFAADCEKWIGWPISNLRSEKYRDAWEVWEDRKYIAGIKGAPCTGELKKTVRFKFQQPDDIQIFGYTAEKREVQRAERIQEANFEVDFEFPLIEHGLTKANCHAIVRAAGIELPFMYLLGFQNNNCIGCCKGGAGYWNMIRIHFPDVFWRMAALCRRLGVRLVRQDGRRIFLDELRPETGIQHDEPDIECGVMCDSALSTLQLTSESK